MLDKASADFKGPVDVLRGAPGIKPKYQSEIWEGLTAGTIGALVPDDANPADYAIVEGVLSRLGRLYGWLNEESGGTDPLVPKNEPGYSSRLRYWATLMTYWVRGDPLSLVLRRTIAWHARNGTITIEDYSSGTRLLRTVAFDANSAQHINVIIENTMRDLEGGLRFKIISYLENYYDLSVRALGVDHAGKNLATLVEYGSTDPKVINLQEIGFSRGVALKLLGNFADFLAFGVDEELEAIDRERLLSNNDLDDETRAEVENILAKDELVA